MTNREQSSKVYHSYSQEETSRTRKRRKRKKKEVKGDVSKEVQKGLRGFIARNRKGKNERKCDQEDHNHYTAADATR